MWILNRFVRRDGRYGLIGDVEEMYHHIAKKGRNKANLWIWGHVISTLVTAFIHHLFWGYVMWKNYCKIAVRHLIKNKMTSFCG